MWPPQSVNTWPTPAPLSVRATSSPPVIQSEGAAPSEPPRLSSRQPPRFTDSPRLRLRLALRPRDGLRLARPHPQTRLGRRGPSPATACGSHDHIHRLASAGGAPAPRRPAARTTTSTDSPRPAGPQPRDGLRLARPHPQTRLAARLAEPPRPPLGSHCHIHRLASAGGAPAPQRPAARTATSTDSPRPAGPQPRDGLRLARPLTRISPT